jgi:glycosyltransferase involved in cell wall biosynthesis
LKIAWLTPWSAQSAIARSAASVATELEKRGHEVTVLRTETGSALELPPLPASRDVHALAHWSAHDIRRQFDVAVAHVGDHFGFHGALLPKLNELSFIGIFHDAFLADLAYVWLDGNEEALRAIVAQTYGGTAWPPGEAFMHDLGAVMQQRPMLEWVARHAVAGVAHAEHYADRLRNSCAGPVAVIPLAFEYESFPPIPAAWGGMTVAVVGHVNANKRIDQLVLAISSSHLLRRRCKIKLIGETTATERDRIERLARTVGILPPQFTGWVSDEELRWHLRDVDVISCLRNPVLEGASASLILGMCSRRPTLVTNHGCYAELPDDTLLKCSPEHEAVDVMRHLERVLREPAKFTEMGERAHHLAVQRHAPSAYIDRLVPLLKEAVENGPAVNAARDLVRTLSGFGLAGGDPAEMRVRDLLNGLLKKT